MTHFRKHLLQAILTAAAFAAFESLLHGTQFAQHCESAVYHFLVKRVERLRAPQSNVRITIVDISELGRQYDPTIGVSVTPPAQIASILEAIHHHHPRAVGVDIDFHAHKVGGDFLFPSGFEVLQEKLLSLSPPERPPSVFLGIYEDLSRPQTTWLGSGFFAARHAASIVLPDPVSFIPIESISVHKQRVPSMAYALAKAYNPAFVRDPGWLESFVRFDPPDSASASNSTFLLNAGELPRFDSNIVTWAPNSNFSSVQHRRDFANAIVLIGDVEYASDKVIVPGWFKPQPGVAVHAAGVATLLERPLFALSSKAGILATLLTLILTALAMSHVPAHQLQAVSFVTALPCMALVVLVSVALAIFGYIWLDVYLLLLLELVKLVFEAVRLHFRALFHPAP